MLRINNNNYTIRATDPNGAELVIAPVWGKNESGELTLTVNSSIRLTPSDLKALGEEAEDLLLASREREKERRRCYDCGSPLRERLLLCKKCRERRLKASLSK
ncbi:MAG: hypothetical protein QXG32_00715 [Candidatus Bathyarchaeia archaeon]